MTTEGVWNHARNKHGEEFPRSDNSNCATTTSAGLDESRRPEMEEDTELSMAFRNQMNVMIFFILLVLYSFGTGYTCWITTIFSFLFLYPVVVRL